MRKIFFIFAAAALIAGLGGCSKTRIVDGAHNSQNSLNWEGVYSGTTPSASGSGINVTLTLRTDSTYTLKYEYIGREDGNFTTEGKFTWDKDGGMIKLDAKDEPPYYRVGENKLIQLDMSGELISGEWADSYILLKQ